jgi:hypothetical protein
MTDQTIPHRDFYVYALFRSDGVTPFYIGKGRGSRINIHERTALRETSHKDRIIRAMLARDETVPTAKLLEHLTDDEAKQIERDLIQLIGRWPIGPLANLTSGGDGVTSLAPASRARKSAANVKAWMDPEVRRKRIEGIKRVWTEERREEHRQHQRTLATPEKRARISASCKRSWQTPEVKAKLDAANSSPECRKKKSNAMKASWKDEAQRAHRLASSKAAQSSPEYRAKRSRIGKQLWQNPDMRARIIATKKENYRRNPMTAEEAQRRAARIIAPEVLAKSQATNRRPEVRERRIAAQRAAFSTPEAKAKRSEISKKMWAAKKAHQYADPSLKDTGLKPYPNTPQSPPQPAPKLPP